MGIASVAFRLGSAKFLSINVGMSKQNKGMTGKRVEGKKEGKKHKHQPEKHRETSKGEPKSLPSLKILTQSLHRTNSALTN